MKIKKDLTSKQVSDLLSVLKKRFEKHMHRHKDLKWENIQTKLENNPKKLWSLNLMEESGGEPDVTGFDSKTNEYIFYDCSMESPKERRSFCYDQEALNSRKANKPKNSAVSAANEMGITLLTVKEYQHLQSLENFDTKTSSWLLTPANIRKLGGAIFGDFRFDTVFIYHNGAESYYAARGFRGSLRV